jgi:uncharacterized membrane protein
MQRTIRSEYEKGLLGHAKDAFIQLFTESFFVMLIGFRKSLTYLCLSLAILVGICFFWLVVPLAAFSRRSDAKKRFLRYSKIKGLK